MLLQRELSTADMSSNVRDNRCLQCFVPVPDLLYNSPYSNHECRDCRFTKIRHHERMQDVYDCFLTSGRDKEIEDGSAMATTVLFTAFGYADSMPLIGYKGALHD